MSSSLNMVALTGRLTRDAEQKSYGERTCESFSLAVSRRQKGQDGQWTEAASFVDIRYWTKSPAIHQYLAKGKAVGVAGELVQDRWQGQDGQSHSKIYVNARDVVLLGGDRQEQAPQKQDTPAVQAVRQAFQGGKSPAPAQTVETFDDDVIPF